MRYALLAFTEAGQDVAYRTIHIKECTRVVLERDDHVEFLDVHDEPSCSTDKALATCSKPKSKKLKVHRYYYSASLMLNLTHILLE